MKLLRNVVVTGMASGLVLAALPMVTFAQPGPNWEQIRASNPQISHAIHDLEVAVATLKAAPDDYGGNKATAIADSLHAIHSLKKALYYRLKLDDAAIDKAP